MFTVAYVFRRPDGMSLEEFHHHYQHVHAPIARQLPGLLSYTQMPVRQGGPNIWHITDDMPFDAISVYSFESDEAAASAFDCEVNELLQQDSYKFINFDDMLMLSVNVRQFTAASNVER